MNKLLISLLLLSSFLHSYAASPTPPVLTLAQSGSETIAQWTPVENATSYTLYYAPYPDGTPLGQAEMGNNTRFSTMLPDHSAYYVAIKAHNQEGSSEYSNIDFFSLPPATPPVPHQPLVDERAGGWRGEGTYPFSPVVMGAKGYLKTSTCQTTGLVYREVTSTTYRVNVVDYGDGSFLTLPASEPLSPGKTATLVTRYELAQAALVYYEVDRLGQATKTTLFTTEETLQPNWSLVFDSSCNPHVLHLVGNRYEHWQRKGRVWVNQEVAIDWSTLGEVSYLQPGTALLGQDNRVHLLFNVTLTDNSRRFVDAVLLHNDWQGGVWQPKFANALLTREAFGNETLDYAVDQQGRVHVVYAFEVQGVNRNLQYALLNQEAWQTEIVLLGEDVIGQGFTTVARYATLALDNQGQPAIASTFVRHVDTGSYQYAQLLYHTRVNGQWQNQIVAQESDNYAGADGTRFTGDYPSLVFDQNNVPHIVFTDIASWHNSRGENETLSGQLRYATLTPASTWALETVMRQTAPSGSPNPLNGLMAPAVAIANDGKRLAMGVGES